MANYLNKSKIKERAGWTEAAIKKFLGDPDKEVPNPFYKSAAPLKHYLQERVEGIELNLDFQSFVEKSKVRKIGAANAVKTKIEKMKSYAADIQVNVPEYESIDELYAQAIEHYNKRTKATIDRKNERNEFRVERIGDHVFEYEPEYFEPTTVDNIEKEELYRITLNYIRHQLKEYEFELLRHNAKNRGKVGKEEAYMSVKFKINDEIVKRYPMLSAASERCKDWTTSQCSWEKADREYKRKMFPFA